MAQSEYEFLAEQYGYGKSLADLRQEYYKNPPTGGGGAGGAITINGETNTVFTIDKSDVGLNNVNNTADANKPVSTTQQQALDLKAPLASPVFTGTPTGITKSHVGLGNVDNTPDSQKPISFAQSEAINSKANILHAHDIDDILDIADYAANAMQQNTPADFRAFVGAMADDAIVGRDQVEGLESELAVRPPKKYMTLSAYNALSLAEKTNGTEYWVR